MMKFYMKQHFMSIRQNFEIYDQAGDVVFQVRGRMPWLRRQMTILDAKSGTELATVTQAMWQLFFQRLTISIGGQAVATIRSKIMTWSDTFEIEIYDETIHPVLVLAVVLGIDTVRDSAEN